MSIRSVPYFAWISVIGNNTQDSSHKNHKHTKSQTQDSSHKNHKHARFITWKSQTHKIHHKDKTRTEITHTMTNQQIKNDTSHHPTKDDTPPRHILLILNITHTSDAVLHQATNKILSLSHTCISQTTSGTQ